MTLVRRLGPCFVALMVMLCATLLAVDAWKEGVKFESWRKMQAKVMKRWSSDSRGDGTGGGTAMTVAYNVKGRNYSLTLSPASSDLVVEIWVNPNNPSEASRGFRKPFFLTCVLTAVTSGVALGLLGLLAFYPGLASRDHRYENSW